MRALFVACLVAAAVSAQAGDVAVVHFADGSSLPLRDWTFSYEYVLRKPETAAPFATPTSRPSPELLVGKRSQRVTGSLTLQIAEELRDREEGGIPVKRKVPVVRGLELLGADGKKTRLKLEAPQHEVLVPEADPRMIYEPRSLAIVGESLSGGRREICLASYTALVECGLDPGERVVRVDFEQ
jgi:hypothetical protein